MQGIVSMMAYTQKFTHTHSYTHVHVYTSMLRSHLQVGGQLEGGPADEDLTLLTYLQPKHTYITYST